MAIADGFSQILIAVIVGVGISIPITSSVISQTNLTGTDAIAAAFITTLIIVAVIVFVSSFI